MIIRYIATSSFPGQLPAPQVQPPNDFYLPPPANQPSPFHTTNFLPGSGLLPPFPPKPSFHPLPNPMEQLSLRLSPASTDKEQTIHSTNSENSDDEDIDVVKSAFVPIKPASVMLQEVQVHPDSTVEEPVKTKCELKAPTSRKTSSPPTKLGGGNKTVWRPY